MKTFAVAFYLTLVTPLSLFAGYQNFPLQNVSYQVSSQNNRVTISLVGRQENNKTMACEVSEITYSGRVQSIDCASLSYKCSLNHFHVVGNKLLADVTSSSLDGDAFATLSIGTLTPSGALLFNSSIVKSVSSAYVENHYNLVEKALGAEDTHFCAISAQ